MRYSLSNGKDRVYQWDRGITITILEPENVPEVHFKWGGKGVPFAVANQQVEIPPELMQLPHDIILWAYMPNHTMDMARIPLEERQKPSDYVYTPTEIKTWETLDARIAALEAANVQPNWNQNDTSAADYVRGRTHYVGSKHDVRIIKQGSGEFTPELGLIIGNSYRVWYTISGEFGNDGNEFVCKDYNDGKDGMEPTPYVGNADVNGGPGPYLIFDNNIELHFAFSHAVGPSSWKIEGDFADIKTLDSKYLDPELLARIKALEDGGGVAGVSSVNGQTGAVTITAEGLGALTENDLQSATNAALAQAKASGEFDGAQGPKGDTGATGPTGPAGAGLDVTGATVGQTVKISAVDDNGVPTAWVPVDMANGGGEREWVKLYDGTTTITDEVSAIEVDILRSDTAKKFQIWLSFSANEAADWGSDKYITANINGASVCYANFVTTRLNSAYEVFFQVNCEGYIYTYAVSGNVRIRYNKYPLYFQGWGDHQKNNGKLQIKFGAPYKGTMNALVWGEY